MEGQVGLGQDHLWLLGVARGGGGIALLAARRRDDVLQQEPARRRWTITWSNRIIASKPGDQCEVAKHKNLKLKIGLYTVLCTVVRAIHFRYLW